MSTRSSSSNRIPHFSDPESVIRNQRRNLGDPSLLLDFEEINMNSNNVQGPPPAGPPPQNHNGPPGPNLHMSALDLRTMEDLCQPTMNGRGGPIAPINIQATDFGLKNHMIQQVQNSCQFHSWGTFMKRRPEECYDLIENMTAHHNKWDTSAQRGCGTRIGDDNGPSTHREYYKRPTFGSLVVSRYYFFELPPAPVSSHVIPEQNPHQPTKPYPLRLNKEKLQDKADIQIHSFLQLFKKIYLNISFTEALAHMLKFAKMVKDLFTNKEKLLELPNSPLNENCSAMLLKKLPKKLGDTRRFFIPCDFYGLESCMALAELGASINLMPLSVLKTLSPPKLSLTRVTLELATRTVAYPAGIAEDVFV
nr:reverse transcriptase domain-containing protein [Tanacetum cinerariifolium]